MAITAPPLPKSEIGVPFQFLPYGDRRRQGRRTTPGPSRPARCLSDSCSTRRRCGRRDAADRRLVPRSRSPRRTRKAGPRDYAATLVSLPNSPSHPATSVRQGWSALSREAHGDRRRPSEEMEGQDRAAPARDSLRSNARPAERYADAAGPLPRDVRSDGRPQGDVQEDTPHRSTRLAGCGERSAERSEEKRPPSADRRLVRPGDPLDPLTII